MNDDGVITIAVVAAFGFFLLFLGVVINNDNAYRLAQHDKITEMVKAGADPILAACAVSQVGSKNRECSVRIGQLLPVR